MNLPSCDHGEATTQTRAAGGCNEREAAKVQLEDRSGADALAVGFSRRASGSVMNRAK